MDDLRIVRLRALVEAGGGKWLGIQETVEPPALVLFNSPNTKTTLAMYEDLVTEDSVRAKLAHSDRAFNAVPIHISRDNYNQLIRCLQSSLEILTRKSK